MSSGGIDCWRLLGVPRNAGAAEVRAAFAKRARDVHPDGGGTGDSLTMRLLVEARDEALRLAGGGGGERTRSSSSSSASSSSQGTARDRHARRRSSRSSSGPRDRCADCGGTFPRGQLSRRPARAGGVDAVLRFVSRAAPAAANVLVCRSCAERTGDVAGRRDRLMMMTAFALSTVATVGLVVYMLNAY